MRYPWDPSIFWPQRCCDGHVLVSEHLTHARMQTHNVARLQCGHIYRETHVNANTSHPYAVNGIENKNQIEKTPTQRCRIWTAEKKSRWRLRRHWQHVCACAPVHMTSTSSGRTNTAKQIVRRTQYAAWTPSASTEKSINFVSKYVVRRPSWAHSYIVEESSGNSTVRSLYWIIIVHMQWLLSLILCVLPVRIANIHAHTHSILGAQAHWERSPLAHNQPVAHRFLCASDDDDTTFNILLHQ